MNLPFIPALGCAASLALGAIGSNSAQADPMPMHAVECQNANSSADTIFHTDFGVGTFGNVTSAQTVVCSLPGPPPGSGAISGAYTITGDNINLASTTCGVFTFGEDGAMLGSLSFVTHDPHYHVGIGLNPALFSATGHAILRCIVPAHADGYLLGAILWN